MNIAICYCYLNIAIHLSFDHCYDHTDPAYVISWSIRVQTMQNCYRFVKCTICKMLTRKAPVELHTHGDVPIPPPRTDSDVATANGRIEWICHHGVTISVSSEILSTITFFVLHEIDGVNAVFNIILRDPLTDILPSLG